MSTTPRAKIHHFGFMCFITLALLSLAAFLYFLGLATGLTQHEGTINPVTLHWNWVPTLDINMDFYFDGLSLVFLLMITGIGSVIFFYSASYFKTMAYNLRIALLLALFSVSMLGLVAADNLVTLFIFWELTTLTSYFLIATKHDQETARKHALQALIITGLGGLALLAGFILLGAATKTYKISAIILQDMSQHPHYLWIFFLIALGCLTKSAQFPFHFWLPNAMAAPTPISAYLHSATMVKAGVYVLARFYPSLGNTAIWHTTLLILGGITAIWGAILAVRQTDLKLMMAYTTLMALGTLTLLLGAGTSMALTALVTFLLVHALYKAALFMVVGNIEKVTGTREWPEIVLLHKVPTFTAIIGILSSLSMAGLPPFLGFITKELQYKSALSLSQESFLMIGTMVSAAILIAGIAFFLIIKIFRNHKTAKSPSIPLPFLRQGPLFLLALCGALFGIAPAYFIQNLLSASTMAIASKPAIELKLWYGLDPAVYLSGITVVLGLLMAGYFVQINHILKRTLDHIPITTSQIYEKILKIVTLFAIWQTHKLQNGQQRFYIMTTFITLIFLSGLVLFHHPITLRCTLTDILHVPFYQIFVVVLISMGVITTGFDRSRLLSICSLGLVGTGTAVLFVIFSAPDLAMTQIMVEILVVIIMTIVMLRLPAFCGKSHGSKMGQVRDILIASSMGLVVTLAMIHVTNAPFDSRITSYYAQNSYTQALGKNIVNVILVDFRAFDTLGEIIVLAIAGLACLALIKLKVTSRTSKNREATP